MFYLSLLFATLITISVNQDIYPNSDLNFAQYIPPYNYGKPLSIYMKLYFTNMHFDEESFSLFATIYTYLNYTNDNYCKSDESWYKCFKSHRGLILPSYHLFGNGISRSGRSDENIRMMQRHDMKFPCFRLTNQNQLRYICYDVMYLPIPANITCPKNGCVSFYYNLTNKFYWAEQPIVIQRQWKFYDGMNAKNLYIHVYVNYKPQIDFDTALCLPIIGMIVLTFVQYLLPITSKNRLILIIIMITIAIMSATQVRFDYKMKSRLGDNYVYLLHGIACVNLIGLAWTIISNHLIGKYASDKLFHAESTGQFDLVTKIDDQSILVKIDNLLISKVVQFLILPQWKSGAPSSIAIYTRFMMFCDRFVGLAMVITVVTLICLYSKLYN